MNYKSRILSCSLIVLVCAAIILTISNDHSKPEDADILSVPQEYIGYPPMNMYHCIAHSGGGIDGKTDTDSREAWEHSYENGTRIFDANLNLTSDGYLVLRHNWNDNLEQGDTAILESTPKTNSLLGTTVYRTSRQSAMTFESFETTPVFSKYTSMSAEDMLNFLSEHNDAYTVCDTKSGLNKECLSKLSNLLKQPQYHDLTDRIIVCISSYDEYLENCKIYDWASYELRNVSSTAMKEEEILDICGKVKNCHIVNFAAGHFDADLTQRLKEKNIYVYVSVVNYISDAKYYYTRGAQGIISDFIYEDDWDHITGN